MKPHHILAWIIGVFAGLTANIIARGLPLSLASFQQEMQTSGGVGMIIVEGLLGGLIAFLITRGIVG